MPGNDGCAKRSLDIPDRPVYKSTQIMKLMRLVKTIFILMLITASANFSHAADLLPPTQPKASATATIMAKPAIATTGVSM